MYKKKILYVNIIFCRAENENYGDSAIGFVELNREGSFCHIRGKVCPEHRDHNKLYSVSMLVDEENEKIEYVNYKYNI